jgi:uncharacterized membrane protein YbhN (UPF0104 family)
MQVTTRIVLRRSVALLLTAIFFVYLWSIRHDLLSALRNLHGSQLGAIAGLLTLQWGIRAWRDRSLYGAAGYRLGPAAVYWSNNVQLSLNYLPLKAGTLSSAGFLLSTFGVRLQDFAVVLGQQYLLNALASSVLAAGALWLVPGREGAGTVLGTLAFVGIGATAFGFLAWDGFGRFLPANVAERFRQSGVRSLAILKHDAPAAMAAMALTMAMCLVSAARMIVVFGIVGVDVGFADSLVLSASLMLSALLAVTPAGLGITESLVGLTAALLSHSGPEGVMAATIDRAAILALSILIGLALAPLAWRPAKRS